LSGGAGERGNGSRRIAKHGVGGKVAALIPAAGSGTRLGMGFKALVDVGGKSLLERAIVNLAPYVDEVVVAINSEMQGEVERLLERLSPPLPFLDRAARLGENGTFRASPPIGPVRLSPSLISGGPTRQLSVKNLLEATSAEFVLIHDAARPFLEARVVRDMLSAVKTHGAATVALKSADTLISSSGEVWGDLLDRSQTYAIQTPQGGRRDWLQAAHVQALEGGWEATDDAGLLARAGHRVHLVRGDSRLFKVTTQEDLHMARALAHSIA